ncbi:MAG: FCD domain-containing protein [Deltaproteobacteria bacterium]|nr:FCD domain-containing protein [Deltaproteobacteria bacterium]
MAQDPAPPPQARKPLRGGQPGKHTEDNALHALLQELAGNRVLDDILHKLRAKVALYRHQQIYEPGRFDDSMREHREILEALRNQDPNAAETRMKHHRNSSARPWCIFTPGVMRRCSGCPDSELPLMGNPLTEGDEKMDPRKACKRGLVVAAALWSVGMLLLTPSLTTAAELKISHQFAESDARHHLAVEFGRSAQATGGAVTFKVFPPRPSSRPVPSRSHVQGRAGHVGISRSPTPPERSRTRYHPDALHHRQRRGRHGVAQQGDRQSVTEKICEGHRG